jgi:hypothetical protein
MYTLSRDSIVKGIIDDIIKTAVKTAKVDKQKTKYLHHFINKISNQISFDFERKTFGISRMYTLSPSKSINGSNTGNFSKTKMYCYEHDGTSTLRICVLK